VIDASTAPAAAPTGVPLSWTASLIGRPDAGDGLDRRIASSGAGRAIPVSDGGLGPTREIASIR
jgi:hypothetical protein